MDRPAVTPPLRSGRERRPRRPRSLRSGLGCEPLERRDCPAGLFTIEPPAGPIIEGDRATFTVRLAAPSSQPERVLVSTVAETATLGRDYTFQNSQQLLFAPGTTTRQFTINTLSDTLREGVETLRIVVSPMNRPGTLPVTTRAAIYDLVPTTVSVGDIRVTEGNEGTTNANFTVRLTAGAILPVTLQYATRNGTATAGTDYTATTGTLTFAPGEFVKTVSVPILGDRSAEVDETFQLVLSNPSRGTTIRTPQATCTIVNDETDQLGFQITADYRTTMEPAWRTAVERAAAKWSSIIVGDLPGVTYEGRFIDDFEISVSVQPLSANLLGFARTLQSRPGVGGLPFLGEMVMNSLYANQAGFYDTVVHELAHALGFNPTLWTSMGLFGGTLADPRFTGVNATREFNQIFSRTDAGVPLYEVGQPGDESYGAHWRDSVFGNEVMVSASDPNVTGQPISRITVASMQDIGYSVNIAAADRYVAGGGARFVLPPVMAVAARQSSETITIMAVPRPSVKLTTAKPVANAATTVRLATAATVKPDDRRPQPASRPTTPPRPKAIAPASSAGVSAAFSTLGRLR
jgi:hypothetical protein